MPEDDQLARLVVRRAAGFHANEARRELGEEREQLRTPQGLPDGHRARCIDGVNLKCMLGETQADGCDFHGGWLLVPVALTATYSDTEM